MIICARLLDYGCEVINVKVLEDDEKITLPKCNFSLKSLQSMIGCNCFVDINAYPSSKDLSKGGWLIGAYISSPNILSLASSIFIFYTSSIWLI